MAGDYDGVTAMVLLFWDWDFGCLLEAGEALSSKSSVFTSSAGGDILMFTMTVGHVIGVLACPLD